MAYWHFEIESAHIGFYRPIFAQCVELRKGIQYDKQTFQTIQKRVLRFL